MLGGVEGATKRLHSEEGGVGRRETLKQEKERANHMQSSCEGKGKEEAVEQSSRKETLQHLR